METLKYYDGELVKIHSKNIQRLFPKIKNQTQYLQALMCNDIKRPFTIIKVLQNR